MSVYRYKWIPASKGILIVFWTSLALAFIFWLIATQVGVGSPNFYKEMGYITSADKLCVILFIVAAGFLAITLILLPLVFDLALLSLFVFLAGPWIFITSFEILHPSSNPTAGRLVNDAFEAVGYNNIIKLAEILNLKPDAINATGYRANTLLHQASARGFKTIVEMLLDKGANPNACNNNRKSSLDLASHYGHQPLSELILERGGLSCVESANSPNNAVPAGTTVNR